MCDTKPDPSLLRFIAWWYTWLFFFYKFQYFFKECYKIHECKKKFVYPSHSFVNTAISNIHCFSASIHCRLVEIDSHVSTKRYLWYIHHVIEVMSRTSKITRPVILLHNIERTFYIVYMTIVCSVYKRVRLRTGSSTRHSFQRTCPKFISDLFYHSLLLLWAFFVIIDLNAFGLSEALTTTVYAFKSK